MPAPPDDGATPPLAALLGLGLATFTLAFGAYLLGQLLVLANVPLALLLTSLLVFGAAGLVFPTIFNLRTGPFTGAETFPVSRTALAVLLGLVNFGFATFLMGAAQNLLPPGWSEGAKELTRLLLRADGNARLLLVLAAGVAAPIGEELFFRGWLQGLFSQRLRAFTSAFVVAVVFSFVHLDAVGFVARLELGLLFGLVRLWTGSLWPAIALHATHNLVSLAALYFADDPFAELDQPFPWRESALLAAASLAGIVGLGAVFRRGAVAQAVAPAIAVDDARPPFAFTPELARWRVAAVLVLTLTSAALIATYGHALPGGDLLRRLPTPVVAPPGEVLPPE